jgi:hypothetical protein
MSIIYYQVITYGKIKICGIEFVHKNNYLKIKNTAILLMKAKFISSLQEAYLPVR